MRASEFLRLTETLSENRRQDAEFTAAIHGIKLK